MSGVRDAEPPDPEEVGRAVLKLIRPPEAPPIRGAVTVADERGVRVEPWHRSVTVRRPSSTLEVDVPPARKRTDRERADELALRFVATLRAREALLGRPITPDDLSDQEYRAFGAEFWKRGEPVSVETMKRVAEMYLRAVQRGSGRDARWAPGGGRR